jgi:hypothetical protein
MEVHTNVLAKPNNMEIPNEPKSTLAKSRQMCNKNIG